MALAEAMRQGPRKYLLAQMDQPVSRYSYSTSAGQRRSAIHTAGAMDFCQTVSGGQENCWRDYYSSLPVQWEFFRHAVSNPDQLRQRLAFALSQIMVTSDRELDGTYGFAEYHQMLRDHAFGNYRTVLEKVITSPFMGAYLNMADNDPADPNENFAREMLQLFSIGACELEEDGSLRSGKCVATYSNEIVRNYAYALTGWTYPAGGVDPWCDANCSRSRWTNPRYYRGPMLAKASHHDQQPRPLLSGVVAAAEPHAAAGPRGRTRLADGASEHGPVHRQAADPVLRHQQSLRGLRRPGRQGVSQRGIHRRLRLDRRRRQPATCAPPWRRCCSTRRRATRRSPRLLPTAGCASRCTMSPAPCVRPTASPTATASWRTGAGAAR